MIIKNGDIRNIAFLTGACGTGKSTAMRHDIKDCYEHTKDTIVIIDFYGECTELVKSLDGTEIVLPNKFNSFNPLPFDKKARVISVNLRYVPDDLLLVAYIYAISYIKNNLQPKNTIRFYFEGLDYILRTQARTLESIKYFKKLFKHSKQNHEIIVFTGYDEDFIATMISPSDIVVLVFGMDEKYLNKLVRQDIISDITSARLAPLINYEINLPCQFKYIEFRGDYVAVVLCNEWK